MPLKKALPVLFFLALFCPGLRAQNSQAPVVFAKDYTRRLIKEVRGKQDILSAGYDYRPWHKFQEDNSHRAVHAAEDKDAEFFAWDQAEKALGQMEKFSKDLKAAQSRPSLTQAEFRGLVAELLGAFKPLKLDDDHDLMRYYLAQLPPLESVSAGQAAHARAGREIQAFQGTHQASLGRIGALADAGTAQQAFDASRGRNAAAELPAAVGGDGPGSRADQAQQKPWAGRPQPPPEPKIAVRAPSPEEKKTRQEKDFESARTKVILGATAAVLAVPVAVVAITGGVAAVGGAVVVAAAAGAVVLGGSLYAWGASQMPDGGWEKIHDQFRLSEPAKHGQKT